MSEQYRRALRACGEKLLKLSRHEEYELFCYTQQCFFGKNTWTDLTKSHRGALYHKARWVNRPFKKIFNVDEVEDATMDIVSRRMETEDYEIMHKANGHLFIASAFTDAEGEQHLVFHTKGGLSNPENDLLNDDIHIFASLYGTRFASVIEKFPNSTWMFEAVVAHDKHSMYEHDAERYGENAFVLLGSNINDEGGWHHSDYETLEMIARFVGCPVVDSFTPDQLSESVSDWYDASNTEGYVIRFPSDDTRVKIKTRDYWANRFMKEMTTESILNKFATKGGSDEFLTSLPEEKVESIKLLLANQYETWWSSVHVDAASVFGLIIDVMDEPLTREERAGLFARTDLTMPQKQTIAAISDGKQPVDEIWGKKNLREKFRDYIMESEERVAHFDELLQDIASE